MHEQKHTRVNNDTHSSLLHPKITFPSVECLFVDFKGSLCCFFLEEIQTQIFEYLQSESQKYEICE